MKGETEEERIAFISSNVAISSLSFLRKSFNLLVVGVSLPQIKVRCNYAGLLQLCALHQMNRETKYVGPGCYFRKMLIFSNIR